MITVLADEVVRLQISVGEDMACEECAVKQRTFVSLLPQMAPKPSKKPLRPTGLPDVVLGVVLVLVRLTSERYIERRLVLSSYWSV